MWNKKGKSDIGTENKKVCKKGKSNQNYCFEGR